MRRAYGPRSTSPGATSSPVGSQRLTANGRGVAARSCGDRVVDALGRVAVQPVRAEAAALADGGRQLDRREAAERPEHDRHVDVRTGSPRAPGHGASLRRRGLDATAAQSSSGRSSRSTNRRVRSFCGLREEVLRRAALDDDALVEEEHFVGDLAREAQLVGHDRHGPALVGELLEHDRALRPRVRGRGRWSARRTGAGPAAAPARARCRRAAAGRPTARTDRRRASRSGPTRSSSASARATASFFATPCAWTGPSMTFSRTVRCGNRLWCWNTIAERSRSAVRSAFDTGFAKSMAGPPSKATTPASGVSSPLSDRSTVVLPEPLGPMSTTTSPRRTSKSTPFERPRFEPKLFDSPVTCSSGRSSAGAGGASGSRRGVNGRHSGRASSRSCPAPPRGRGRTASRSVPPRGRWP